MFHFAGWRRAAWIKQGTDLPQPSVQAARWSSSSGGSLPSHWQDTQTCPRLCQGQSKWTLLIFLFACPQTKLIIKSKQGNTGNRDMLFGIQFYLLYSPTMTIIFETVFPSRQFFNSKLWKNVWYGIWYVEKNSHNLRTSPIPNENTVSMKMPKVCGLFCCGQLN